MSGDADGSAYRLYRCSCWMLRWLQRPLGGIAAIDSERLPATGPVIVAANHASYLDPIVAGLSCRRPLHFMARASLFAFPVFGTLIRWHNAFPVEREGDPRAALRACGQRLERGEAVLLFPEGTRTRDGRLGPVKGGVGMLATRYHAPILPVYIWGTRRAWPAGRVWMRPHPMRVFYGKPIVAAGDARSEQRRLVEATGEALHALEHRARAWEALRDHA